MKVGVFQFCGSSSISNNQKAIVRAITKASQNRVRLLVFQECAATGYPPVETPDVKSIDFETLRLYSQEIIALARKYDMYIALGTIRKERSEYFNSLILIDPHGETLGNYDKRALWGWDLDNFREGNALGIHEIDGIRVGFRICYEVRFPEYFRDLILEFW